MAGERKEDAVVVAEEGLVEEDEATVVEDAVCSLGRSSKLTLPRFTKAATVGEAKVSWIDLFCPK